MGTSQKISLLLEGKRIVSYTVISPEEGIDPLLIDEEPQILVDINELEFLQSNMYRYYEDGVKAMNKLKAIVSTNAIKNDGASSFEFQVETDSPAQVHISQSVGTKVNTFTINREPVDGTITVEISSKIIGSISVLLIGDKEYTDEMVVQVEEASI